jgi:DNA-binding MarR family transcriptional regulator
MTDLERIDSALIALRHLWSIPPRIEDPALGQVEMSTIWVVDSLRHGIPGSVADLAASMGVAHSTASRLVARAEQAGAVVRGPDPDDQRRTTVTLTDAGRHLALTALQYRLAVLRRATRTWTPADRSTFAALLTRFAHGEEPR